MHIVGEGPGETPLALRRFSYMINSFLTDTTAVKLKDAYSLEGKL